MTDSTGARDLPPEHAAPGRWTMCATERYHRDNAWATAFLNRSGAGPAVT